MLVKNLSYKNLVFSDDNYSAYRINIEDVNFDIDGRTQIFQNQLSNGGDTTRTLANLRLFTISGVITGITPEQRQIGVNKIREIVFIGTGEEFFDLSWEDFLGGKYKTKCKVYKMPQFKHKIQEPTIDFTFELLADVSEYISFDTTISNTLYDPLIYNGGGVELGVELGNELGQASGIEIYNYGNYDATCKVQVIGSLTAPRISNNRNNRAYGVTGDTTDFIVDNTGKKLSITDVGVDIQARRITGSVGILLAPGMNTIRLIANNDTTGKQIKVYYNNTYM